MKSLIRMLGICLCAGITGNIAAAAVTAEQADQATQAFNKTYWNAAGKYFYKNDNKTGTLDFWLSAHAWETIMDAYVRTGSAGYRQQITDVYDGFVKMHGTDWAKNNFNDDIAWWIIASTRAYEITGDTRYLTQAKTEFDWVYGTQRDSVKGGIWWKNNEHGDKNSCVVQPMIISAANLSRDLKDDTYRVKAESLYAWQRRTLVDANTGKVYDNINNSGNRSSYSSTYNQGTWIGSAVALGHLADARKCADWTKANMCNTGGVFTESGQGDVGAFKLIGARYIMGLSRQPGNETYAAWMEANAAKVWDNRRADGIMGYNWNSAAPASGIEAQSAAGGVSLLNLLAPGSVSIRPQASRSCRHPGARMILSAHGDGTETNWLFRADPDEGHSGLNASGLPAPLRRLDGRAQP